MFLAVSLIIYLYVSGVITFATLMLVNTFPQNRTIYDWLAVIFWFITVWIMVYELLK